MAEIEDNITKLFANVTNCSYDDATEILFGKATCPDFVNVLGEEKLELVRAQAQFYLKTRSQMQELEDESLKGMLDSLGEEQLHQAETQIAKFMFCAYDQKCISKDELTARCKKVYNETENASLKQGILAAAEEALGEPLFVENY